VRRRWTDRFAILDYLEADGWWLSQNLIIAQPRLAVLARLDVHETVEKLGRELSSVQRTVQ